MSELRLIESVVRRASRRRRLHRLWVGLWSGMLWGSLTCLIILGLYKLAPLPAWLPWAGLGAGVTVWLGRLLVPSFRRVSPLETARWLDHKNQWQERITTALELAEQNQSGEWEHLVVVDAARRVRDFDGKRFLPLTFPRLGKWAVVALLSAVGLGFVPEYRTAAVRERAADQARIRETGRKLADLVRQDLARRPPALAPTQRALEATAETGDALAKAPRTREAALRELTNLQNELSQHARALADRPGVRSLHDEARETSSAGSSKALQDKISELRKALGQAGEKPDQLADLQRELEQVKKEAAAMSQKDPAGAAAARSDLAKSLAEAAQQARNLGAALPGLEAAMAALEASNDDVFLRDLNAAVTDLEKMRELARQLESLAQQGARTGKDLAEQLEKGQAEAAHGNLQRMIEQLQSAQLSKEELEKILKEVAKAVDPASEYGQVAQHLKEAARELKKNDSKEAAQSLAKAAQELQEVMKQAQDLEALEGAMAALARAQNALAARKSWSEAQAAGACPGCNGMGCALCKGRPGFAKGGRGGTGVGTWAENESSNYLPQDGELGDNSGVQRPELDPRGLSDRPADLSPNLLPDRVKGKLSPGESMPSISLKGLSIPGQSVVEFEAAAAAAQAEAQNALNQDRVPRAYHEAVKGYFDDFEELKKK